MKLQTVAQTAWADIGQGTPEILTEPLAILLVGSWLILTWASFSFNSAVSVLGWMFTSVMLVMVVVGALPLEAYWVTLILNSIAVGSTVVYDAR